MQFEALTSLPPAAVRTMLPTYLAGHLADEAVAAANQELIARMTADWSDEAIAELMSFLTTLGSEHRVYPANPLCRSLSRVWARSIVPEFSVHGVGHIPADGPVVLLCNHLSYFDSSALDGVLAWAGHAEIADRVLSLAGPKVYETLFRRVASGCLNTLPVPQSASLGHTAQLSPRELARLARVSINATGDVLDAGYAPLLFAEGSRSRSGRLQPFLKGAHRYLGTRPGTQAVPVALLGTGTIMAVGDDKMAASPVHVTFGKPIDVDAVGARSALAEAHVALGALLPPPLRPPDGSPSVA
jgi:1-acyl-sn-glycerol-3-phosphate acyltransferase